MHLSLILGAISGYIHLGVERKTSQKDLPGHLGHPKRKIIYKNNSRSKLDTKSQNNKGKLKVLFD